MKLFSLKCYDSLINTKFLIINFSQVFSSFKQAYFRAPYNSINLYYR